MSVWIALLTGAGRRIDAGSAVKTGKAEEESESHAFEASIVSRPTGSRGIWTVLRLRSPLPHRHAPFKFGRLIALEPWLASPELALAQRCRTAQHSKAAHGQSLVIFELFLVAVKWYKALSSSMIPFASLLHQNIKRYSTHSSLTLKLTSLKPTN